MVHFCCVPNCSSNSKRDVGLSFFTLPLKKKGLLRQWKHVIGRKNLPINKNTRVCSRHFENATGRSLRSDEVPSIALPTLKTSTSSKLRKAPKPRKITEELHVRADSNTADDVCSDGLDVAVQTEDSVLEELTELKSKLAVITKELEMKKEQFKSQILRLSHIKDNDSKVSFYTGFPSNKTLEACFKFLGPAVSQLQYGNLCDGKPGKRCRPHALPPSKEFFFNIGSSQTRTHGRRSSIQIWYFTTYYFMNNFSLDQLFIFEVQRDTIMAS